jgi:succinoglycan biosynthesis protein ExoV
LHLQLQFYDEIPNFGDALNPLLAEKLFGSTLQGPSSDRLLLIGTIIGRHAPDGTHEHIIGAGAGYKRGHYSVANRTIYALRGPITCDLLGLSRDYAAIDPGILVSRFFTEAHPTGVAFMPHHKSHDRAGWFLEAACRQLNITYISPLEETTATLAKIAGAEQLITEALHGAVTAESYEVPWTPVVFSHNVLSAKWHDFAATIGTRYAPVDISTNLSFDAKIHIGNRIKYALRRVGLGKEKYKYLPVRKLNNDSLASFMRLLTAAINSAPVRSDRQQKMRSVERLDKGIGRFNELWGH